jgi:hypothetical protein
MFLAMQSSGCMYEYLLAIAGETAIPNLLTFFNETHEYILRATPGIFFS